MYKQKTLCGRCVNVEVLKFAMHQPICHCVNKMLLQSAHMSISHIHTDAVSKTFEMHSSRIYMRCIVLANKCLHYMYSPTPAMRNMWRNLGLEGVEEMKRTRQYTESFKNLKLPNPPTSLFVFEIVGVVVFETPMANSFCNRSCNNNKSLNFHDPSTCAYMYYVILRNMYTQP